MSQLANSAGFRPELGLPWFNYVTQGMSPEQVAKKLEGCVPFRFDTDNMAPAFPIGTQVVLRPVSCKCKLTVGKVYVLLTKGGDFVAYGRLSEAEDSEQLDRYGVRLTLHWDSGQLAREPWIWPHPGLVLYALAYYGAVDIAAL